MEFGVFHNDEGREFVGAVDDWLIGHAQSLTHDWGLRFECEQFTRRKCGVLENVVFRCLGHQANAPVCLWLDTAEQVNEVYNQRKRTMHGQNDVVEPIVMEGRAFSRQAECDLLPRERERPCAWPPWGCLAFAVKLEYPTVRRGSLDPIALQGIFVGWNRRMPHGITIAIFRDDGEFEEVFTSTTVRTRDTVFPLFGETGMTSATEAKL